MSEKAKFVIRNSQKHGQGVFARRAIKKGEVVHVFDGKRVTLNEVVQRIIAGKENPNDPLQIGRRTYLDLDKLSRTFNHSCNPNAGMRKRSELFALRDIEIGEEITFDYSMTIAPTDWQMKCRCSARICRGTIRDIRSVPKPRLRFYQEAGAVQRYMKPIIKEIESGVYEMPRYEVLALERLGKMKHENPDVL